MNTPPATNEENPSTASPDHSGLMKPTSATRCPHLVSPYADAVLKTQPNEQRCANTKEKHILALKPCCPISNNPETGSQLEIEYRVHRLILEVASLRAYVDSYQGGRGEVRSMEGMIQQITQDCANAVETTVHVVARLKINPDQEMELTCSAHPKAAARSLGA